MLIVLTKIQNSSEFISLFFSYDMKLMQNKDSMISWGYKHNRKGTQKVEPYPKNNYDNL